VNSSVTESIGEVDDELVEQALGLLPQVGKLLYAGVVRHPLARGLSLAQIKAMIHLHHLRGGQPCTVGEVASAVGVSMPAASELVDRLVEAGMVERASDPADRRRVMLRLTPRAERFTTELRAMRRAQLRSALARLEPGERPAFVRSLRALVEALAEDREEATAAAVPAVGAAGAG
jgi:DNA-binding MarR family transcriptional regulator